MANIDVKQRGGEPIVDITPPASGVFEEVAIDFHASFNGDPRIWGAGPSVERAVGECLRTASSLSALTSFSLPESMRDLSSQELGERAWAGEIPGIQTKRVEARRIKDDEK